MQARQRRKRTVIAEQVLEYMSRRGGQHSAGTFHTEPLKAVERYWPVGGSTIETGCGASTIIASNLSKKHVSFTYDDQSLENGSVRFTTDCSLYRPETVEFIFGPTQQTLPRYSFSGLIDGALIDGPHGFPFPQLEYYFIYPNLKTDAILIVDDVHIPTIFQMYSFLREEPMFEFIEKSENTAFFRRTSVPTFDPLCDGWFLQEFNKHRFPMMGREEYVAHYFPAWLTNLFPASVKIAVKEWLRKTS